MAYSGPPDERTAAVLLPVLRIVRVAPPDDVPVMLTGLVPPKLSEG